ncbi:MAG: DUF882 domain-containing protein [Devosiaceae bacterium]|nr:DUF882 domain-containing protein [Devosiaceae bacterium]
MAFITILITVISPANASRDTRTLYVYYTHTKETAKITFKRNGRYDKKGLAELNHMTRDWRRNEPTNMDPALFDLVWEVYKESGASGPIHIVSAYRSPKTNEMLRSRSRAVAKGSRHTKGQALDFFIPGVSIRKLREIAMKKQVGGVGYYPASNSPFVHLDTGSVRAWPRMTTAQLKRLFPNGRTLHVPNTGVPISNKGYQYAMAQWKKCNAVPCSSRSTPRATTRVANATNNNSARASASSNNGNPTNLFDLFFGDRNENSSTNEVRVAKATSTQVAAPKSNRPPKAPTPQARLKNTIQIAQISPEKTPTPFTRPSSIIDTQLTELVIKSANDAIQVATNNDAGDSTQPISPAPRILLSRLSDSEINPQISAYAPVNIATPNAQLAVKELIENEKAKASLDKITTASVLGSLNAGLPIIPQSLIDSSFSAVINSNNIQLASGEKKLKPLKLTQREFDLVLPDLFHIAEIFTDPQAMSSKRYAVIFEPDVADFNPALELGGFGEKLSFGKYANSGLKMNQFTSSSPLLVASK